MQNHSAFQRCGIGIVALDKRLDRNTIEVEPIEWAGMIDGELSDKWDEVNVSGSRADGSSYTSKAKFTKTIEADWLSMHQANRMTAPDVRRGDKVQLFRMGDSTKFYWDVMNRPGNARLETVVYGYSATKKEDDKTPTPDNSYTHGVSTHNHFFNLGHTCKANGERFAYDIFVDTKNGHVVIKDDIGNEITLQSSTKTIRLQTAGGGYIDIEGSTIRSKGQWTHNGTFSANGVFANDVSLSSHTHMETGRGSPTMGPDASGMPWSGDKSKLNIDHRNPGLMK